MFLGVVGGLVEVFAVVGDGFVDVGTGVVWTGLGVVVSRAAVGTNGVMLADFLGSDGVVGWCVVAFVVVMTVVVVVVVVLVAVAFDVIVVVVVAVDVAGSFVGVAGRVVGVVAWVAGETIPDPLSCVKGVVCTLLGTTVEVAGGCVGVEALDAEMLVTVGTDCCVTFEKSS